MGVLQNNAAKLTAEQPEIAEEIEAKMAEVQNQWDNLKSKVGHCDTLCV